MNSGNGEVSMSQQTYSTKFAPCRSLLQPAAVTLLLLATVLTLAPATSLAKEKKPVSKTLSGTVFDDGGNPIVGAAIELSDVQTGKVLDEYSQQDGTYQFADLSFDHDYKVKATYKGRSAEERSVSSLDSRSRPVVNFTIPKGK